jgi:hypothetical protein
MALEAGKRLGITAIPIEAEVKIGSNWSETH